MPVLVRNLDDDAATILMVDSNFQRENILPSERAFAFKLKLEAMKHQGNRAIYFTQFGQKLNTPLRYVANSPVKVEIKFSAISA